MFMVTEEIDIVVVGAGAAGLMAAIFAGRAGEGLRIAAFDGASRIGAKILIAGGGRCNVTHHEVSPNDFNGNRNLIRKVLKSFDVPATRRFFEDELGVRLKREETGKLFPVTDRAATVLEALLGEVSRAGVELRREWRIESIDPTDGEFLLRSPRGEVSTRHLIIATGGRSVPKTGSDGAGYQFVRSLGHTVSSPFPALVPLTISRGHWMTTLRGISHEVELRLRDGNGKILVRRRGSMLLTHFGLSGPVVLDISRDWIEASRTSPVTLDASLFPDDDFESIDNLIRQSAATTPHLSVTGLLGRTMPDRLAEAIAIHAAGLDSSAAIGKLSRDERKRLVRSLIELPLPVSGNRGFDYAEVTAGGVPLEEIDTATMESRVTPGLYLCGEILDVDGRIGGFNFQWAWASGRLAGVSAAKGTAPG